MDQSQVLEEAPTSEEMAHDEGDPEATKTQIPSSSAQINNEPIALQKVKRKVDVPIVGNRCMENKKIQRTRNDLSMEMHSNEGKSVSMYPRRP